MWWVKTYYEVDDENTEETMKPLNILKNDISHLRYEGDGKSATKVERERVADGGISTFSNKKLSYDIASTTDNNVSGIGKQIEYRYIQTQRILRPTDRKLNYTLLKLLAKKDLPSEGFIDEKPSINENVLYFGKDANDSREYSDSVSAATTRFFKCA